MNGAQQPKSKSELIAEARAKRGMPPVQAKPAADPPPAGGVPAVVQRTVAAPRVAPAVQTAPSPAPAQQARPAPRAPQVRPPQQAPATQVARVERPEPRQLVVNEVGEDLLRISRAFAKTPQFQGAPLIVTYEVHADSGLIGVSVTEAIPGTMHPRFVADGMTLQDATAKLMRRFRQAS